MKSQTKADKMKEFLALKKKKSRCIEVQINSGLIRDKIIELLSLTGHVLDRDEVVDVDFTMLPETTGCIPVKIYIKKGVKS